MTPIKPKWYEVREVTPGGGANGASIIVNLVCGSCSYKWEERYHMAQLSIGYPHTVCPNCDTAHYVPYTMAGRGG